MSAARTTVRRVAWAVSAALVIGPLAGCSGSADPRPSAATTPTSSAPADGAAPTAEAPATSPSAEPAATADAGPTGDAEPTDVATDPPVDVGPGSDLEVVVSYAGAEPGSGAVEVSGFVPGLVEDGGRCVLVLGRAGRDDVSVEGGAFADAQSTACDLLSVPVGQLSPGEWTARLDYRSDSSSGSSADVTVDVP